MRLFPFERAANRQHRWKPSHDTGLEQSRRAASDTPRRRRRQHRTSALSSIITAVGGAVCHFPGASGHLRGFLDYRAALHAAGVIVGFQWVDGSFVENIEALEGRQPNDVDVMTFYAVPEASHDNLFDISSAETESALHIDAYFYPIDLPLTPDRVQLIAYWYSIFAHRRDGSWKGFVEVDLSPFEDPAARLALNEQMQKEGWTL